MQLCCYHNPYDFLENQRFQLRHQNILSAHYNNHIFLFGNYHNLILYLILDAQMEYEILLDNYHSIKPNEHELNIL